MEIYLTLGELALLGGGLWWVFRLHLRSKKNKKRIEDLEAVVQENHTREEGV